MLTVAAPAEIGAAFASVAETAVDSAAGRRVTEVVVDCFLDLPETDNCFSASLADFGLVDCLTACGVADLCAGRAVPLASLGLETVRVVVRQSS